VGPLLELIFFAVLSAYIFYRLWSVLGQESDKDKERREEKRRQFEAMIEDNIISLPNRQSRAQGINVAEDSLKPGVREGLRLLQERETDFNFSQFLTGAKGAYEMVLEAFAKGDRETLQLLLTPKVYDAFQAEIEDRDRRGETYSVAIESFDKIDVDAIEIQGEQVFISVRYRTHQVMVTQNSDGEVIENNSQKYFPLPGTKVLIIDAKAAELYCLKYKNERHLETQIIDNWIRKYNLRNNFSYRRFHLQFFKNLK